MVQLDRSPLFYERSEQIHLTGVHPFLIKTQIPKVINSGNNFGKIPSNNP